jgi:hypothetical protein
MDSRGVNDIMTGDLRQWLYPRDTSPGTVSNLLVDVLPMLQGPAVKARLRSHIADNYSVDVMADGNLGAYAGAGKTQALSVDRKEIAGRLWEHAVETIERGGRPRDALFAMRGAVRLDKASVFQAYHLGLIARTANQSRLDSAKSYLKQNEPQGPNIQIGLGDVIRAAGIHPGILFTRR